jgi:hypothetical protein
VNNLRIFCVRWNALPAADFRVRGLPVARFVATSNVLFAPQKFVNDLTTAILYRAVTETYYPIALMLWREKN